MEEVAVVAVPNRAKAVQINPVVPTLFVTISTNNVDHTWTVDWS